MFGTNPQRPPEQSDGSRLRVQEAFYTIQGEGPLAGTPAVFVRLWGCNLACHFCDTDFESSEWGPDMCELVSKIYALNKRRTDLVVLTGGEPLRQNVVPLIAELTAAGHRVQIETSGSLYLEELHNFFCRDGWNTIVCSPKTGKVHPKLLPLIDAWKYIVKEGGCSEEDGLPLGSTQTEGDPCILYRPPDAFKRDVYLQPCDDENREANTQYAKELCLRFGYRMSLQTHKLVGLP